MSQAWQGVLDLLGISASAAGDSVRLAGGKGCFSSKPGRNSLATAHRVKLTSMEQSRALVSGSSQTAGSGDDAAVPSGHVSEGRLRRALFSHVVGREMEADGYGSLV